MPMVAVFTLLQLPSAVLKMRQSPRLWIYAHSNCVLFAPMDDHKKEDCLFPLNLLHTILEYSYIFGKRNQLSVNQIILA